MMEVAIAFAGILVGWALSLLTQLWMERRAARRNARLVSVELIQNHVKLTEALATSVMEWKDRYVLRTAAWEAHASAVFGLLSNQDRNRTQLAYLGLDRAQRILDKSFDAFGELEGGEGSRVEDAQTALDENRDFLDEVTGHVDYAWRAIAEKVRP